MHHPQGRSSTHHATSKSSLKAFAASDCERLQVFRPYSPVAFLIIDADFAIASLAEALPSCCEH
jgi:hypothetical protein